MDELRIGMYQSVLPDTGRKPGGVEIFVDRLARALSARGHDVTVHAFSAGVEDAADGVPHQRAPPPAPRRVVGPYHPPGGV
jgi:hypothetical protein